MAMGMSVRLMASSGSSCGGGAGAHGDKPPRASGWWATAVAWLWSVDGSEGDDG